MTQKPAALEALKKKPMSRDEMASDYFDPLEDRYSMGFNDAIDACISALTPPPQAEGEALEWFNDLMRRLGTLHGLEPKTLEHIETIRQALSARVGDGEVKEFLRSIAFPKRGTPEETMDIMGLVGTATKLLFAMGYKYGD